MKIFQSTLFFQPVTGGQEVYVEKLAKTAINIGESNVIQPRYGFKKSKLCLDGINILFINLPRGLSRINELIPYFVFKFLLKFSYTNFLSKDDIIIYHYSSLYVKKFHPINKSIVISHGRDWNEKSWSGKYKINSLLEAYKDGVRIVCNDLDVSNFIMQKMHEPVEITNTNNKHKNLIYLPNFYDSDLFVCPDKKNKNFIVMVRNIRKSRGLDIAIKGYSKYIQSGGTLDFKIIGGPLKGEYYKDLKRLINNLGLTKKVDFCGVVNRKEMPNIYKNAAVSIVPSVAYEGTSISALESMASGCPCLSTKVGGLNDLPTIKFDNENDLGSKIHLHINDNPMQIAKSVEQFSSQTWSKEWEKILNNKE